MQKWYRIKNRIISNALILLTSGLLIFLATEIFAVKNKLDNPTQTLFLDSNNKQINKRNAKNQHETLSPKIYSYLAKEIDTASLSDQSFSSNPFRRSICKLLLTSFYDDRDLVNIALDQLYLGNGNIGIDSGAIYYFNKELKQTSELEQLFLLSKGIHENKAGSTAEQFKKFISQLDGLQYSDEQIDKLLHSLYHEQSYAQSYLQQTITEATSILNISEEALIRSGYIIETNLNKTIQREIHSQFAQKHNFPEQEGFHVESGMVILDRNTGATVALMGGRNYQHNSLNRASDIKRQPASTFKPLIVYAPALEQGWAPTDQLMDVPLKIGDFKPRNYDHTFRQQTSLEEALVHSYNVPTVWLLYKIGLKNGLDYLKKFDLFEIDEMDGYQLALGYSSKGSNPLEIAQAYTIFPNEGTMFVASTIRTIKTTSGKAVYKAKPNKKSIITSKTAKTMDKLLQETVKTGTGSKAYIEGQTIAGKTGTTSYDGWFVGYNKEFVSAVWMGPDEVNPKRKISVDGGGYPALLFKKVFTEISK
ncbi:transglycosylase domain-containing protein [Bacillus marasmi]|uniref:transglycosylase domain-containing protein n=1 Tax=Bacillus marasmi TaxID=1926279 RepID=UPI0011CAFD27|nr:penicillin-binding transpeptidase domain-containing protein [Bacillus marasmi]